MRELSKEELLKFRAGHYLTVGQLKKFIEENELLDDAIVVVQRIEDRYYDGIDISGFAGCSNTKDGIYPPGSKTQGWPVYLREGEQYHWAVERNKRIDGEYNDKEQYPDLDVSELKKLTEEELNELKNQYSPVWSPVSYPDKDILFLDLHY